jgi:hypothetical protein
MEATLSTLRIYIYFLAQNRNTFPTRVPIQNLTLRRIQVVNNNKNIIFPIKIKITKLHTQFYRFTYGMPQYMKNVSVTVETILYNF